MGAGYSRNHCWSNLWSYSNNNNNNSNNYFCNSKTRFIWSTVILSKNDYEMLMYNGGIM